MEKSVLERIQEPNVQNRYNMTSSNHLFPAPQHNGRVPNILDSQGNAYASSAYRRTAEGASIFGTTTRQDMIGHLHKATPLNEVFFSDANINKIQDDIREQVHIMSGGKYSIDRQSDEQVKIIMRSYYLMHAQNNPLQVADELLALNKMVVGYAAAKIYSEVDFHKFYLNDLQEFAPPIANPTNVGVYGTRTGELKSFF